MAETAQKEMTHKCSACGHEDELTRKEVARALGSVRTPKKEAAWKRNGERLKAVFEQAKKGRSP